MQVYNSNFSHYFIMHVYQEDAYSTDSTEGGKLEEGDHWAVTNLVDDSVPWKGKT